MIISNWLRIGRAMERSWIFGIGFERFIGVSPEMDFYVQGGGLVFRWNWYIWVFISVYYTSGAGFLSITFGSHFFA